MGRRFFRSPIDFFRKIPEELEIKSSSGFFFSIVSLVCLFYLVFSHYTSYQTPKTRTAITLDPFQEDLLRINFNLSLLNVPCAYTSVDLVDHTDQKIYNITRHIRHFRIRGTRREKSQLNAPAKGIDIQRMQEIYMVHEKDYGIPLWGGIQRQKKAAVGIHYSNQLNQETFDDFLIKYELVLVNFYAPWCPFCQHLNPEWERAAAELQNHPEYNEKVAMASVDCTNPNPNHLCYRAGIQAYPSMLIYMQGMTSTRFLYNGPRTAGSLLEFLDLFYRRLDPDADFAEEVNVMEQQVLVEKNRSIASQKEEAMSETLEGCEISGSISVNRVPGKVMFTARSANQSFHAAFGSINVSHVVNHFSFGQMRKKKKTYLKKT